MEGELCSGSLYTCSWIKSQWFTVYTLFIRLSLIQQFLFEIIKTLNNLDYGDVFLFQMAKITNLKQTVVLNLSVLIALTP